MARIGGRRNVLAMYHNARRRNYHRRNLAQHNKSYRTGETFLKALGTPPKKFK